MYDIRESRGALYSLPESVPPARRALLLAGDRRFVMCSLITFKVSFRTWLSWPWLACLGLLNRLRASLAEAFGVVVAGAGSESDFAALRGKVTGAASAPDAVVVLVG